MQEKDNKDLKFRYLLWLYKAVKDEFDRIERKFTQLDIDREMLKSMQAHLNLEQAQERGKLEQLLQEFQEYIDKKAKDGRDLKFSGEQLKAEYHWLSVKLAAVDEVMGKELGESGRREVKDLYEQEMRKRILESKEHS